jgi:NifU-like protein involved in Fe-S cluster formation
VSDSDLINLYSKRILAMAADIPHTGRLETPMGTGKARAPLCGSVVTVDLDISDGRISRFAQDVKACALGQAAASVMGGAALGATRPDIAAARTALADMLAAEGPVPKAPYDALAVMEAARGFGNRHASILLSFDATLAAFDDALTHA